MNLRLGKELAQLDVLRQSSCIPKYTCMKHDHVEKRTSFSQERGVRLTALKTSNTRVAVPARCGGDRRSTVRGATGTATTMTSLALTQSTLAERSRGSGMSHPSVERLCAMRHWSLAGARMNIVDVPTLCHLRPAPSRYFRVLKHGH